MQTFKILFSIFFDICRFKLGPQDLPASSLLLKITLLFYMMVGGILSLLQSSVKEALLSTLLEATMMVLLVSSLLYFTHLSTRIVQTLTALAGTGTIITILSIPLVDWFEQAKLAQQDLTLPIILILCFMWWNFAVYAHILRQALEVNLSTSLIVTMVIYIFTLTVLEQLIPLSH
jgi:hypothetical protein